MLLFQVLSKKAKRQRLQQQEEDRKKAQKEKERLEKLNAKRLSKQKEQQQRRRNHEKGSNVGVEMSKESGWGCIFFKCYNINFHLNIVVKTKND